MNSEEKVCISVSEPSVSGLLSALKGLSFAEVRLDGLDKKPNGGEIRKIFSAKISLIATCRPRISDGGKKGKLPMKISEEERKALLISAIESGAKYVDIEVENKNGFNSEIVKAARKTGCQVIVSFHDYEKTPPQAELERILDWCFESGAGIAKIACKVESKAECARLLGLLDSNRKLVVIGMGKIGRLVRIAAPLLGSQFTYASAGKGKETAQGQIEAKEMERILKGLQ